MQGPQKEQDAIVTRRLTCFQPLAHREGALKAFESEARELFPNSRQQGPTRVRLSLSTGALRRDVDVHLGLAWHLISGWWRPLTWIPVEQSGDLLPMHRLLPTFVGELGLVGDDSTLALDGVYEPPMGRAGDVVDMVAMHRVAERTAQELLRDLATRIDELAMSSSASPEDLATSP